MESRNSYALEAKTTFIDENVDVIVVEYYTECPNVTVDPFTLVLKDVSTDGSRNTIYHYQEIWQWNDEAKTYQQQSEQMRVLSTSESYTLKKESILEDFCNSDVKITDNHGNTTVRKVTKIPRRDKKWIVPKSQQRDVVNLDPLGSVGSTRVLPSTIQWDVDYEQGDD